MSSLRAVSALAFTLAVGLATAAVAAEPPAEGAGAVTPAHPSRAEVLELMRYQREIQLDPEQKATWDSVLTKIPAPCCSNFSAATCCCPCNLAVAIWGLTKHLIVHQQLPADQIRARVIEWIDASHPHGSSGNACTKGRCGASFADDGCGGMKRGLLVMEE